MRGPARLQPGPDEVEHFHKLAEDEDAMSAVDNFAEQLVEQVELGRGVGLFVRRKTEQAQIAAGLPQAEQAGQHFHPGGAVVRPARAETLLDFAQKRVVGRALGRAQLARHALLDFIRQLARAVGFAEAEE